MSLTVFQLDIDEAGMNRLYFKVTGTVDLTSQPYTQQHGYNIFKVELDGFYHQICPVPYKGSASVMLGGQIYKSVDITTPTYHDPFHYKMKKIPGGKVMKYTVTEPITLPDSIPIVNYVTACGNKGSDIGVKLKLKRMNGAQNIHSDQFGNLYIYCIDKIFVYVKQ